MKRLLACTGLKTAVVLLSTCLAYSPIFAKDKHLPLPPKLMAAKSVFIDNRSGSASLGDRAFQEMTDWGRFRIVQEREDADLIFLLSLRSENRGSVTSGGNQTGSINSNGEIDVTTSPRTTTALVYNYSGLTIVDAKTGANLWGDSEVAALFRKSAIKRAIGQLRKRIEEQEKPPKKR